MSIKHSEELRKLVAQRTALEKEVAKLEKQISSIDADIIVNHTDIQRGEKVQAPADIFNPPRDIFVREISITRDYKDRLVLSARGNNVRKDGKVGERRDVAIFLLEA